ncbi:UDP-N-acetyl-D-mannosamine dehydrogenase [Cohnella boryungensis]|uniref:UDP-N-acetyl-D-mannosamine dehydrogenase n=1 Tax=Cohnella boryungensis TaxID=768479 RepID=A0ABV8S7X6_9BACL
MGLGYIGLPTASLLATKGYYVHGVDVNQHAVDTINKGEIHIYEPDLDVMVKASVQSGHLVASTEPEEADIYIIAVPTPFKEDHVPDISYVEAATKAIAPYINPGNLIILESTSPIGTTDNIAAWITGMRPDLIVENEDAANERSNRQIYISHCPERVLPGQILKELIDNDRIIGGINSSSTKVAEKFYRHFVKGKILLTNARTAELAKLTENAYRDVNIAFANELSLICEKLDIDVWELISLANHHPRVNILQPGPGVGGHCIAVDPWFIIGAAPEESKLIHQARIVNDNKPFHIVNKIKSKAEKLKAPIIACLGLSFKKNIDDLRESPAVQIVNLLAKDHSLKVLIAEPHISGLPPVLSQYSNVNLTSTEHAISSADIVVLLVDHDEFGTIDRTILEEKMIIDTRGIWK